MNESMIRYYKILEVDSGASLEDIRTAYRQMSQVWHPDRFNDSPSLQSKAKKHMKEINLAYTKLLQHIAEKNRQAALRAFESGVGYFRAERYDKAVEYFMRAIEIIPDHFDAHFWMAQAYYRLRQLGKAMPCLENAKRLNPNDPRIYYAIGINYFESGLFRRACDALLECLELDANHLDAWCKSGAAYAERGDWVEAIAMYTEAVQRAPDRFDILVNLAITYRKSGDLEAALHWLELAVTISSKNAYSQSYTENLLHDLRYQIEEREQEAFRQAESRICDYDEAQV